MKKWYWTWEGDTGLVSLDECKAYYEEVRDEYEECGGSFESYMIDATGKNGTLVDLSEALEYYERMLEESSSALDFFGWDEEDLEDGYISGIVDTIETIKARMEEN